MERTLSFGGWQHLEVGTRGRSHEGRAESGSQQEGRRDEERSRGRRGRRITEHGEDWQPHLPVAGEQSQSCLPHCEADSCEDPKQSSDLLKGPVLSPRP